MRHTIRATALIAATILVGACGPGAVATTAPAATTAASAAAGLVFLDERCGGSGSSSCTAGTYRTRQFQPAFSVTVPASWRLARLLRTFVGGDESAAGITLSQGTGEIVVTVPSSLEPPAPGDEGKTVPADLVVWLAANKNLSLGASQPVTIGGVEGQQLDGIVAADAKVDAADGGAYRLSDYLLFKPGQHVRLAVLKIGGAQVILATVAAAADWDAFVKDADMVITSIAWLT
ncbi:MAG: hypothetical protein ACAH65_11790 [Chloroflexota bacterium]